MLEARAQGCEGLRLLPFRLRLPAGGHPTRPEIDDRGSHPPVTLEAAWNAVFEALPARWRVGPPTYDPGAGCWSVTARSATRGRGMAPTTVSGTGSDPASALRALDARLRGVPKPDGGRLGEIRRRARLAFIAGAEEWTRQQLGRGLDAEELERVLERAPRPPKIAGVTQRGTDAEHAAALHDPLGSQPKMPGEGRDE